MAVKYKDGCDGQMILHDEFEFTENHHPIDEYEFITNHRPAVRRTKCMHCPRASSYPIWRPDRCHVCFHNETHCKKCGSIQMSSKKYCACTEIELRCSHANKVLPWDYAIQCLACFQNQNILPPIGHVLYRCCGCGLASDVHEFIVYKQQLRVCSICAKKRIVGSLRLNIHDSQVDIVWRYVWHESFLMAGVKTMH